MDVSISTIVAAPTAKLRLHLPPAEKSPVGAPADGGARTSPFELSLFASSLTPIQDTVSFEEMGPPDDAPAGVGRSGSAAGADGTVVLLAPGSGPRTPPDDVTDPTGTITVGAKTLDLATVDYLPTDGPAARALKLRAAIAAVFGAAMPGATGSATAGASTKDPLEAARELVAAQVVAGRGPVGPGDLDATPLWKSETELAAQRITDLRERILSQAGPAVEAQAGSLPESVVQLLR